MVCISHPLGHQHHEHEGPSICELHAKFSGTDDEHFLPPMDCDQVAVSIEDFIPSHEDTLNPNIHKIIAVAALFIELKRLNYYPEFFRLPPDPNCRSATLFLDSPLRAPPLV